MEGLFDPMIVFSDTLRLTIQAAYSQQLTVAEVPQIVTP